jgi:hypothetical protein
MEANRLDEMANILQLTARKVQAKLDEKQTDRLRKLISIGEDGQPEALSWECRLPSGDGGERTYNILRLPWASLNPPQRMVIKELSLEFACDVKKSKSRASNAPEEYRIIPTGSIPTDKAHAHNFKLVASADNDYLPELTINEQTIEEFLDDFDEQLVEKKRRRLKILWGAIIAVSTLGLAAFIMFIIYR